MTKFNCLPLEAGWPLSLCLMGNYPGACAFTLFIRMSFGHWESCGDYDQNNSITYQVPTVGKRFGDKNGHFW